MSLQYQQKIWNKFDLLRPNNWTTSDTIPTRNHFCWVSWCWWCIMVYHANFIITKNGRTCISMKKNASRTDEDNITIIYPWYQWTINQYLLFNLSQILCLNHSNVSHTCTHFTISDKIDGSTAAPWCFVQITILCGMLLWRHLIWKTLKIHESLW